ncbi:DUF2238 domain-containing protein [Pseudoxanthomonas mexicana]|uniref:DUF2238 domain-containing protein n=1 Tax=Pseudoxanthomonas mexicana TaxID=128785 RepID=UPI00398B91D6
MAHGKRWALAATLAVFALSWIAPPWPLEQALHSSLTVAGLAALVWLDRRWPLKTPHYAFVCLFVVVHCIGARWLYSNVPYDEWAQALAGWSPQQAFGWQRNHFDRFVHLLYGLCFAPPVRFHLERHARATPWQAFAIAVLLVMASSLVYEWMEWGIALAMSPEAAESYNGQQGDIWDAHADMLLATLGCVSAWPWRRRAMAGARP